MQKTDLAQETLKGAPPVAVTIAHYAGMSINEILTVVTIVYVVLQIGFLLWKWRRLARGQERDE